MYSVTLRAYLRPSPYKYQKHELRKLRWSNLAEKLVHSSRHELLRVRWSNLAAKSIQAHLSQLQGPEMMYRNRYSKNITFMKVSNVFGRY
jgi:hypothetical protein